MPVRGLRHLHPFLFACFVPLALYARNSNEVAPADLLAPVALVIAATAVVQTTLWLLGRDLQRFGVLISMGWLAFFLYSPLHDLGLQHAALATGLAVGATALVLGTWRLPASRLDTATRALAIVGLILVANPIRVVLSGLVRAARASLVALEPATGEAVRSADRPDIYYLILDGYAGERTLREVFAFDNSPFLSMLKRKGFYVAAESRSNYATTLFSVPSAMNMDYIESMEGRHGRRFDERELKDLAMNGRVVSALKAAGYRFVYVDTSTHLRPADTSSADEYREYAPVSQYATTLYSFTPLRYVPLRYSPLGQPLIPEFDVDGKPWYPHANAWALEQVWRASRDPGPTLVVAHVLSPHSPYYHDAGCNVVERYRRQSWNNFDADFGAYRAAYLGQLECLNAQVTGLLDRLLAEDRRKAIVVVQSDHGPAEILDGALRRYDRDIDLEMFRFHILNALYGPEEFAEHLYASMSPVNTFRLILNHVLNREDELLADRTVARRLSR